MNKTRKEMIESGENAEWCKPMKHKTEDIYLAYHEGEVDAILDNGKEAVRSSTIGKKIWEESDPAMDEKIKELAKRLNSDYDEYEGWDDTHILLDADFEELGCKDCPWFNICDAMDDNS